MLLVARKTEAIFFPTDSTELFLPTYCYNCSLVSAVYNDKRFRLDLQICSEKVQTFIWSSSTNALLFWSGQKLVLIPILGTIHTTWYSMVDPVNDFWSSGRFRTYLFEYRHPKTYNGKLWWLVVKNCYKLISYFICHWNNNLIIKFYNKY